MNVSISLELKDKAPGMALGITRCRVSNSNTQPGLLEEINEYQEYIRQHDTLADVKNIPHIAATRKVYKACGKDPNRYRPATESLYRRIIKGMDLYHINTLVDLVNLVGLKTGYSLGGFDADLIYWPVEAGVGHEKETFYGIGRGALNIAGLPVLRDQEGAIGTPTSDEKRTAISPETTNLFVNINGYSGPDPLQEALDLTRRLLEQYAEATDIIQEIVE